MSWQTEGEKVETVTGFIFLGSKIIVDGDCNHEIKKQTNKQNKTFAPWKESYDKACGCAVAQACLTLRLHELQPGRFPCPSPSPELAQTYFH